MQGWINDVHEPLLGRMGSLVDAIRRSEEKDKHIGTDKV